MNDDIFGKFSDGKQNQQFHWPNILFLVIKKLSACELPMFELCFNVSLVQILFEYILLFSVHDMTDSLVTHKYC